MPAAASIVSQVAAGLEHAHQQGLVHRDVKPGNILVTPDGHAKLSDLGLAGPLLGGAEKDPRFGKIVGTADYLSPDHIQSPWTPAPAWDIYSLGCTAYYAVTGKVPFPGGSTAEKAHAHRHLKPLDPRVLNPNVSTEFADVLAQMMAKRAEERTPRAAAVIEQLRPWAAAPWVPPAAVMSSPAPATVGKVQPAPRAQPVDPALLKDTAVGFPELPEPRPDESPEDRPESMATYTEILPAALPLSVAGEETPSRASVAGATAAPVSVFRPLLFFFLLPAGLVAMITIAWAALRWLR
jgi:serine/threonine protein kinase